MRLRNFGVCLVPVPEWPVPISFRRQPKQILTIRLPAALDARIRRESGGECRRSLAEVTSEVLCLGFGLDPVSFGIEPALPPPCPAAEPAGGT